MAVANYFMRSRTDDFHRKTVDFYFQPNNMSRVMSAFRHRVEKSQLPSVNCLSHRDVTHITFKDMTLYKMLNSLTSWGGEPVDARGAFLKTLLLRNTETSKIVRDIITTNKNLKALYGV